VVFWRLRVVICAIALALVGSPALAQTDADRFGPRLIEEQVRIPARGGYEIVTTILRPQGEGRFGALILNHGVPVSRDERARESSDLLIGAAAVFARRGYVVLMPLRRGFGATGGEFAEDPGSCANPDFRKGELAASDDVMAVYEYARSLPYVDGSRMILAGQSAGGLVAISTAALRSPEGLVAVLSFAAGRGGNPGANPGVPCAVEPLAELLEAEGKRIKAPVLFHYAENDLFFNPQTTKYWYDRFTASGARAEYVLQPAFGKDGHYVFSDMVGVRYWLPAVERFLAANNVPFERLDAQDANVLFALDKLPNLKTESCRNLYRAFLESPGPRAFALSGDGRCGFAGGLPEAADIAMRQCTAVAKVACSLYAVDQAVVWKPLPADGVAVKTSN
jgi:dienelactone hydrolase